MALNEASLKKLEGVHPDLVKVVHRADELTDLPFIISWGLRDLKTQRKFVAAGGSTTLNSRHLTGHAVDFMPLLDGEPTGKWPAYWPIVEVFEQAAKELGIAIECGARWKKFADGGHVQLTWKAYPK